MFGSHTPDSTRSLNGGVQHRFKFSNGFGASVVMHGGSYGGDKGLWELAVLGPDGHLTYDTPVTSDVLGYLAEADVTEALNAIAALDGDAVAAEITRRANDQRDQRIADLRAELDSLEAEVPA